MRKKEFQPFLKKENQNGKISESKKYSNNNFNNHWYTDMRMTLAQFGIRGADVLKYRIDAAEPVYDDTGTPRADFFS